MNRGVLRENIRIAIQSIRGHMLRAVITGLIIAMGITALVGILTSIDAIKYQLTGQLSMLGANTFTIRNAGPDIHIGRGGLRPKTYPKITFQQAREFKDKFHHNSAIVSLSYMATPIAEVSYKNKKTDPNITVWATDENYIQTGGYEIAEGRNISLNEVENAAPVALIGQAVRDKLFENSDPVGKVISVGGQKLKIIGLLKEKGSAFGFGGDKSVFIPITKARYIFSSSSQSHALNVMALLPEVLDNVVAESTVTMRKVRRLDPKSDNNFHITKSDSLSQTLIENLKYVTIAAMVIGAITMLGAAIALMNIMLVSVTERTREIGVRKAVGAKSSTIRSQFLTEAVTICILGGIAGIILGISVGNMVAYFIGASFVIPWMWMLMATTICFITGLVSGLYPAYKASKLDPIESLRHE